MVSFHPDVVDGVRCERVLLKNAEIVKVPTGQNINLSIIIPHIWTVIDAEWRLRNNYSGTEPLKCKGFIYEYKSKGVKT